MPNGNKTLIIFRHASTCRVSEHAICKCFHIWKAIKKFPLDTKCKQDAIGSYTKFIINLYYWYDLCTFTKGNFGMSSDYVSHYSCQWKKFVVTLNLVFLAYRQEKCHDNFFPFVYMF